MGPHRLTAALGIPRSTIGDVLRRHGRSRLADRDRPTGIPIRYVRERPGDLLHMDVKKLGRIPDGGGHRFRGRGQGTPRAHAGYDYVHQVVDDMSRVAYAAICPDERGTTCAAFLREAATFFARLGVRIERVMTDNAKNCTDSRAFAGALDELGARHLTIPPYRPQVNGKSERSDRTLLEEWAYARMYRSNEERIRALRPWLEEYNHRRPHTALGGRTPMQVLIAAVNNVSVNHTLGHGAPIAAEVIIGGDHERLVPASSVPRSRTSFPRRASRDGTCAGQRTPLAVARDPLGVR